MELRQLRHFVVLAEEMHFGRAAARLFITQPALSGSLMRLEESMKVRLFERDSKNVSITRLGRTLLTRAQELVSLADRLEHFGRAVAEGRAGVMEVGFTGTLLFRGLAPLLKNFRDSFPQIELSLRELTSQVQIDMLRTGLLDAGFVSSPVPPAGLQSFALFEESFVACLPEGHPLARRREIEVGALRDAEFVMLSRDVSPTYFDHIVAMCTATGFQPRVSAQAAHVPSVVALVAAGMGVSMMPESVGKLAISGAVFVRLRGVGRAATAFMAWNPRRDVPGLSSLVETVRQAKDTVDH